jgi:hypothetical protein
MIISFSELKGVCHEIHASFVCYCASACLLQCYTFLFDFLWGGFDYVDFKLKESLPQKFKTISSQCKNFHVRRCQADKIHPLKI